jgi:hypothetical protein
VGYDQHGDPFVLGGYGGRGSNGHGWEGPDRW